jgi:DNA modification methylase
MPSLESPAFIRPDKFVHVVNGDIWQLGKHRLACGDATDPAIVHQLLGHARPRLMATDPPYGVGYEPEWRTKLGGTTIIAAEMTRRRCYAIELSPEYCGLAIARWEQLTGHAKRL